jgi:hypothetical protein
MTFHTHSQPATQGTDKASGPTPAVLRSVGDIRAYFANSERNYYFISACNFNMIGMHEWVRGWHNINMLNCFDGEHPAITAIEDDHSRVFRGMEDVNHYLVDQAAVQALVGARAAIRDIRLRRTRPQSAVRDQALFLFFDQSLEDKCHALGLEVALPPQALVREVDSKIVTTRIGDEAGVPSVPNVLTPLRSWAHLQQIARDAGLGTRWVVQSAFGDSGKTTYFIDSEDDYQRIAQAIESQEMVKVMRRVRCVGAAIEACATRWGTFVGPLLTEMIGQESLTPYPGGWCGNENYAAAFTHDQRQQGQQKARAMGDALYQRGYRGTFELDFLFDLDTGDIYLGELNARVTGVTALTNTSEFSQQNIPLFLFHLLEFDGAVDLDMDVDAFNAHVLAHGSTGVSSQLILKHTEASLQMIEQAPASGVYRLGANGELELCKHSWDRRAALGANEAFVLRIQSPGDYAYQGGDLAIAFLNRTVREPDGALSARGRRWTQALQASFVRRALTPEEVESIALAHNPANVKSSGDS